jgi:hypothetical protein
MPHGFALAQSILHMKNKLSCSSSNKKNHRGGINDSPTTVMQNIWNKPSALCFKLALPQLVAFLTIRL